MFDWLLQKIVYYADYGKIRRLERAIGYKLVFQNIPDAWINGWVACEMTRTWKKFGLGIERGSNYFTEGRVEHGVSSRFNRHARQYQSWLGGYVVELRGDSAWNLQDHCNLAVADQDKWLGWYEDAHPFCTMHAEDFKKIGNIKNGAYAGDLYDGECLTHNDVGVRRPTFTLRAAAMVMAALYDISNPRLHLRGRALLPLATRHPYEAVRLKGYLAIFNVAPKVTVVLYGVGAVIGEKDNKFELLKNELRAGLESCKIVPVLK